MRKHRPVLKKGMPDTPSQAVFKPGKTLRILLFGRKLFGNLKLPNNSAEWF
jgi:hypothetical protein